MLDIFTVMIGFLKKLICLKKKQIKVYCFSILLAVLVFCFPLKAEAAITLPGYTDGTYYASSLSELKTYLSGQNLNGDAIDKFMVVLTQDMNVTEQLCITCNVKLNGDGHTLHNKIQSNIVCNMVYIEEGYQVSITGLNLNGNKNYPVNQEISQNDKTKWSHCISVSAGATLSIEYSNIYDAWNHGICSAGTLSVKECNFYGNNFSGIRIDNNGIAEIRDSRIYGNGQNSTGAMDDNNTTDGNTYDGMIFFPGSNVKITECEVGYNTNSQYAGNAGNGIAVYGNAHVEIAYTNVCSFNIREEVLALNGLYGRAYEGGSPTIKVKDSSFVGCGLAGIAVTGNTKLYLSDVSCCKNNQNGLYAEENAHIYCLNGNQQNIFADNYFCGVQLRGNASMEISQKTIAAGNNLEPVIIEQNATMYANGLVAECKNPARYAAIRISSDRTSGSAPLTIDGSIELEGSINLMGTNSFPYVYSKINNPSIEIFCQFPTDLRRILTFQSSSYSDSNIAKKNDRYDSNAPYLYAPAYRDGANIRLCTGHNISVTPHNDAASINNAGTYYYGQDFKITATAVAGRQIQLKKTDGSASGTKGTASEFDGRMYHSNFSLCIESFANAAPLHVYFDANWGTMSGKADGWTSGFEFTDFPIAYGSIFQNLIDSITPNRSVTEGTNLTNDGNYKFAGWYTGRDEAVNQRKAYMGNTGVYDNGAVWNSSGQAVNGEYWNGSGVAATWRKNSGNYTFYANWIPLYKITIHANGGNLGGTGNATSAVLGGGYNVEYGMGYYNQIGYYNPWRTGYTFQGWTDNVSGGSSMWDSSGSAVDGTYWKGSGNNAYFQYRTTTYGSVSLDSYAQWKAKEYTLKLNANGGILPGGATTADLTVIYDSGNNSNIASYQPVLKGSTLTGWTTDDGTLVFNADGSCVNNNGYWSDNKWCRDGGVEVFARWSDNSYTMTLNANGGTMPGNLTTKDLTVTYGATTNNNVSGYKPTRRGYTFTGWKSIGGKDIYNVNGACVNNTGYWYNNKWCYEGNEKAYAQWTANEYTLTLDANGGTMPGNLTTKPLTVTYDSTTNNNVSAYKPTRTGYTFQGWYLTDMTTKIYNINGSCANDGTYWSDSKWHAVTNLTVKAKWTANSYTLTLDANGGTMPGNLTTKALTVTYNSTANNNVSSYKPAKPGYIFTGWSTKTSGGTSVFNSSGACINGCGYWSNNKWCAVTGLKVFAQWTPITYTIHFDGNGATSGSRPDIPCTYDVSVTLTKNAQVPSPYIRTYKADKPGYTFKGWKYSADGTAVNVADGATVKNLTGTNGATVTLFAHWMDETKPEITCPDGGPGVTVPTPEEPDPGTKVTVNTDKTIEYDWINKDVQLNFSAGDYGSGLESFVLTTDAGVVVKNGIIGEGSYNASLDYTVTTEGITKYILTAKDKSGNTTTIRITVKIDKTLPTGDLTVSYLTKTGMTGQASMASLSRLDREEYHALSAVCSITEPDGAGGATPSGIREAKLYIANNDRGETRGYGMTVSADKLTADLTTDVLTDSFFAGDMGYFLEAEDYAGNKLRMAENFDQLTLTTSLRPKFNATPFYRRGEAAILSILTTGYVDKVVIKFPFPVTIGEEETDTYTYSCTYAGGDTGIREEELEFLLPLYAEEKDYTGSLGIQITAYKDDTDQYNPSEDLSSLRSLTRTEEFTIRGSILDDLRTRLR